MFSAEFERENEGIIRGARQVGSFDELRGYLQNWPESSDDPPVTFWHISKRRTIWTHDLAIT